MPTRSEPWPPGTPCWVDLAVPDIPAATRFYSAVLGWSFVDTGDDYGHYHIAQVDGRAAAAIGPLQQEGQPSVWTVYLASDDADATAATITEQGGGVLAAPFDIPGNGRMCVATDPQGAPFGVWQAGGMHGVEVYGEAGSFIWSDVRSPNPDAARAFYAATFGYRYEPVPGAPPEYTTISFDGARAGESVGGIGPMMGAPDGTPPHWLPYFVVPDADAAAASARDGGGTAGEPDDTPYGRMLPITDPNGATFVAIQPPPM